MSGKKVAEKDDGVFRSGQMRIPPDKGSLSFEAETGHGSEETWGGELGGGGGGVVSWCEKSHPQKRNVKANIADKPMAGHIAVLFFICLFRM